MKRISIILIVLTSAFLVGCATQAERLTSNKTSCSMMGFEKNTPAFSSCMLQLRQSHLAQRNRAADILRAFPQTLRNPYTGAAQSFKNPYGGTAQRFQALCTSTNVGQQSFTNCY